MINMHKLIFIMIFSLHLNVLWAACYNDNYNCVCNAGYEALDQGTSSCSCVLSCTDCPAGCPNINWTADVEGYQKYTYMTCSCSTCVVSSYLYRCANNYYGPTTATPTGCNHCPNNSTSTAGSNSSITSCACGSGYYMDNNSTCSSCPAHYSTCGGSTFTCAAGYYKNSAGTACDPGPTGSISPVNSTSVTACSCSANYYGNASLGSACSDCPVNANCAGGNNSTFSCIAGYYNNGSGCANCATATGNLEATSAAGSTSITNCYLPTSYRETDETGEFGFPSNCQYAG